MFYNICDLWRCVRDVWRMQTCPAAHTLTVWKRQETVGIQVETSNQVTIQMLSVSVPANHRYASSNVLHVKLRFPKMSYIIIHITCSSSSSSAGDRSSRQIPAVTRRQKTWYYWKEVWSSAARLFEVNQKHVFWAESWCFSDSNKVVFVPQT